MQPLRPRAPSPMALSDTSLSLSGKRRLAQNSLQSLHVMPCPGLSYLFSSLLNILWTKMSLLLVAMGLTLLREPVLGVRHSLNLWWRIWSDVPNQAHCHQIIISIVFLRFLPNLPGRMRVMMLSGLTVGCQGGESLWRNLNMAS